MKMFNKILLGFFSFVLFIGILGISWILWKSSRDDEAQMARLNKCIEEVLPRMKEKYKIENIEIGQAQIYLATFEPNEFASYPLIKFGKEIPNRFLVITPMSSICDSYESESIIDTD